MARLCKTLPIKYINDIGVCSIGAEALYIRLIAFSDDNCSYFADPAEVTCELFRDRFKSGEVSPTIIDGWLSELEENGFIAFFEVDGERYLNIVGAEMPLNVEDERFPLSEIVNKRRAEKEKNESEKNDLIEIADRVVDHLNDTIEKHGYDFSFKHSKTARSKIVPRVRDDGYSEEDLKLVVEYKCFEWINDKKMRDYIRPVTLFRPSYFEGYLQAAKTWVASGKGSKNSLYKGSKSNDDYGGIVK